MIWNLVKPLIYIHTIKIYGGYLRNINNYFRLFTTHFFTNSTTGTTDTHRVPAIYKILRDRKDRKVFEIKAHPMVSKLFEMKLYNSIKFSVTDVPMLVPPLPWNSTQVYLSFLIYFFNYRNFSWYFVFSRVFYKLVICLLNSKANSTLQIGPVWLCYITGKSLTAYSFLIRPVLIIKWKPLFGPGLNCFGQVQTHFRPNT